MELDSAHPSALPKLQALESYAPQRREEPETKYGHPVFTISLPARLEVHEGDAVRLHGQVVPTADPTLKVSIVQSVSFLLCLHQKEQATPLLSVARSVSF